MSVVYLVRHGQASFGAEDYDQLSEVGQEQGRVLGAALRGRGAFHAAFTGTQRRHQQTAEACLAALGAALPRRALPGLNEFDHDEVLARLDARYADKAQIAADTLSAENPRQAFQDLFARAVARWTSGAHDADYAESWPAFRARSLAALDEVTGALGPSESALVFTSGGPITAICQGLLGLPDAEAFRVSWLLVNCGVTKVLHTARGRRLASLNEHVPFEGPGKALLTYR